jgi:hypothetical protein
MSVSPQQPKEMLCVLVAILHLHRVARQLRFAGSRQVSLALPPCRHTTAP